MRSLELLASLDREKGCVHLFAQACPALGRRACQLLAWPAVSCVSCPAPLPLHLCHLPDCGACSCALALARPLPLAPVAQLLASRQ